MKKVKFSFVAAIVLVAAIAFSAFTTPAKAVKTTSVWFEYMGGPKNDAGSYKIYGNGATFPAGCPRIEDDICAVLLPVSAVPEHTDEPDSDAFADLYENTDELRDEHDNIRHKPIQQ